LQVYGSNAFCTVQQSLAESFIERGGDTFCLCFYFTVMQNREGFHFKIWKYFETSLFKSAL